MKVTGSVTINLADEAPKIIDGYWHEYINGEWINTGIRAEGENAQFIQLSGNTSLHNPGKPGGINSTTITATRFGVPLVMTLAWQYYRNGNWQNTPWTGNSVTVDYATQSHLFENGVARLKCYVMADVSIFAGISITVSRDGEDGADGKSPYIGSNGNWYVWNGTAFVDSGDSATGDDGKSPEIRDGYWWAWNGTSWYNTGVKAKGEDGTPGRGVESIFEQYYLSNSSTTQTSGSWTNSIPTWVAGKYIWSSSFVTYTDGTTERVAITLVPSLSGTSIVSVDVEYARSQSASVKPSSGWSTNAPLAQKRWYIWSRTKIIYSNSPTPVYTNEVCISGHDGTDGVDGDDGDSVIVRYMRAESRPATPTTGVLHPSGWMSQIDNPINSDIYWPGYAGEWTKQSNGEYKSKTITHNENSLFRFTFFNRTAGSSIKITVRTSSESSDKLYVGKLDEGLGENYDNARLSFGGAQSQELTYSLPTKGEHYILFDYKKDSSVNSGSDAAYVKIDFPIQSVWMTTCNVINGVATAWSTPVLFIDNRIEETIAGLDKAKAITDKFGTTVDGGLVNTVMMLLREANSQTVTAGVSGLQGINKNRPSFWSGGTHTQALAFIEFLSKISLGVTPSSDEYANLAKIVLLHSGAGKIGDLIVEKSGRVMIVDPVTGKERIVFSKSDLSSLDSLLDSNVSGDSTVASTANIYMFWGDAEKYVDVPNSTINVTKTGAKITVGQANMQAFVNSYAEYPADIEAEYQASLELWRGTTYVDTIGVINVDNGNTSEALTTQAYTLNSAPAGIYRLRLKLKGFYYYNNDDSGASASVVNPGAVISWTFNQAGVRYFQFGLDGMMAFFSDNHIYFSETGGWDVRGKTNMPGVLLSATVSFNGGFARYWGAKVHNTSTATRNSTGRYTVYHSIGHTNYQIAASPATANRSHHIVSRSTTSFVIEWRTIGSSPALSDTEFDFQLTGNNY